MRINCTYFSIFTYFFIKILKNNNVVICPSSFNLRKKVRTKAPFEGS